MIPRLTRRQFLGVAAASGSGAVLAACGGQEASPAATTTTPPVQVQLAEILTDEDPTSWFADPASVAALGAARVGDLLLGDCAIATPTGTAGVTELREAVATESACGSVVRIGGWFMTPTEAAIAQAVADRMGGD